MDALKDLGATSRDATDVVVVSSDYMRFGGFHESFLSAPSEGDLRGELTSGMPWAPLPLPLHAPGYRNVQRLVPNGFVLGAYARAKLANVLFARELDRRSATSSGVRRATSVHPGLVYTSIIELGGGGGGGNSSMQDRFGAMLGACQKVFSPYFLRSPEVAARVVLTAAVAPIRKSYTNGDDKDSFGDEWLHYANGHGVFLGPRALAFKDTGGLNDDLARRLWDLSVKEVKAYKAKEQPATTRL